MENIKRFLNYVSVETTSDPNIEKKPSSIKELDLARILKKDLIDLGLQDVVLCENGNVYATYKGTNKNKRCIALIAHMDTSPDASGKNIKPQIIKNYDGKDIKLSENIYMKVEDFPFLKDHIGHDLITTDGTTLLGADDKAGIAIIFNVLEDVIKNNIDTGDIKIAFTTDEEIGIGADEFDYDYFKDCDFALTVDGDDVHNIEYENFNAAGVKVVIKGRSTHPGSAKNTMINSIKLALEFDSMLDPNMVPEHTENYEGFNHIHNITGDCEQTIIEYIIRNHDEKEFNKQKQSFIKIKDYLNDKYQKDLVSVEIKDQYFNMAPLVLKRKDILDLIYDSIKASNLEPKYVPIRGGTDGARLTFEGLICPNIGTGGRNYHGRFEFLDLYEFNKAKEIVINLLLKL